MHVFLKICICSGSVVECLTRDEGAQTRASTASLHCVLAQDTFILAKYWFQPRKTCPFITERLLMGRKESNQTKNQTVYFAEACENALFAF